MTIAHDTNIDFADVATRGEVVAEALGALGAQVVSFETRESAAAAGFLTDQANAIHAAAMARLRELDEPLLGLATTRELFDELIARLGHGDPHGAPWAAEELRELATFVGLRRPELLDYRTVGS